MTTAQKDFKIYVASLSDYNNAILHGVWIDMQYTTEDAVWKEINAMLASSPTTKKYGEKAEEWAIHDYENLPSQRFGEHASITELLEYVEAVEEHGEVFEAAFDYETRTVADCKEYVEACYIGQAETVEQFAEDYAIESGQINYDEMSPNSILRYIDFKWYWTGELQHYITDIKYGGTIYFFQME